MRVLIIDNGSSFLPHLQQLVAGNTTTVMPLATVIPTHYQRFDLVLLSGGHGKPVMGNEDTYQQEIDFIKNSPLPIIGICLGCQLIAHIHGSELVEMPTKERGIIKIKTIDDDPIFANLPSDEIDVFESHRWVVSSLSAQMKGLARSEDGFEVIKHVEKPMYGLQFHPEMLPDQTLGDEIFRNIIKAVVN